MLRCVCWHKGRFQSLMCSSVPAINFPGGMLCHVTVTHRATSAGNHSSPCLPIKSSALPASWTEFPQQNSSTFSIMCFSTNARAKVYFKPWQQTRILWKTSWKLLLFLVQQGVKKHLVLLCLAMWVSFALAAVLLARMLCLAELIHCLPTNPQTWGCTRWDSPEGSHTLLEHTCNSKRDGRSSSGIPNPWRSTRIRDSQWSILTLSHSSSKQLLEFSSNLNG